MMSPVKCLALAVLAICASVSLLAAGDHPAPQEQTSVIEGEIGQMSILNNNPDYPDCYVIAQFRIQNIISGPRTPQVVNLAIQCFKNYKKTKYATLKKGMKMRATIISKEHASPKEVATQQADDLNDFARETYFLRKGRQIYSYTRMPESIFLDQIHYVSTYQDPLNTPHPAEVRKQRREQIQGDLATIGAAPPESTIPRSQLQKKWEVLRKDIPQIRPGIYWFQNGTGVFALPQNLNEYWNNDVFRRDGTPNSLQAIYELNQYLQRKNIDLIIVLYPTIYPLAIRAMFQETVGIPIKENRDITRELLKHDVETIDLSAEMVKLIPNSEFLLYYYHLNNHPGWETQDLAGRLVARRLERYKLRKTLSPELFREKRVPAAEWKGYTYPRGVPIGGNVAGETIMTNCTFYNDRSTGNNPSSPVILWGNSFLNWPKNHALVTAVAKHALIFPEMRHGSGCFTTMLKDLLLQPEFFLRDKQVMIIPISVEMITPCKFWNIRDLDDMLKASSATSVVRNIKLPESIEGDEARRRLRTPPGQGESDGAYTR